MEDDFLVKNIKKGEGEETGLPVCPGEKTSGVKWVAYTPCVIFFKS